MPKEQNSEHFPLPSETEKNAGGKHVNDVAARPKPDKMADGRECEGLYSQTFLRVS